MPKNACFIVKQKASAINHACRIRNNPAYAKLLFLLGFVVDNLNAVVVAALFANPVALLHFVALGALYERGNCNLVVACEPFVTSLLGYFSLWNCHIYTPLC